MKLLYSSLLKQTALALAVILSVSFTAQAQACGSAQGDQTTFGTNNVWIGYVYTGTNFNNYQGYVTEGASSNPNFDETFGGDNVTYPTNGCSINTNGFSVRYKLRQNLTGSYTITVGGDDGYRFSIDGGTTWVINNWNDHSYTTGSATINLTGPTDLVVEFYENGGGNRITFNMVFNCTGTGAQNVYGTNNVWQGYLYQGTNFNTFKGSVTEGAAMNPNFDETFGTANGPYYTNSCYATTEQFSARYMLQQNLPWASYVITVGGDDGYRFSLDGGSTWVINNWGDHGYAVTSYTIATSGVKNMVLEYYENGGDNRVSFSMSSTTLPVTLASWSATALSDNQALLKWTATNAVNFDRFTIQRSTDGSNFQDVYSVSSSITGISQQDYSYTDAVNYNGAVYYRVAMIDVDGKTNYSSIATLNFTSNKGVHIYPTVVENGSVYVETSKIIRQARLEIFDMNGRRLQEKSWPSLEGRQQVTVSNGGSSLPAGAYLARVSDGQSTIAKQIILVK